LARRQLEQGFWRSHFTFRWRQNAQLRRGSGSDGVDGVRTGEPKVELIFAVAAVDEVIGTLGGDLSEIEEAMNGPWIVERIRM